LKGAIDRRINGIAAEASCPNEEDDIILSELDPTTSLCSRCSTTSMTVSRKRSKKASTSCWSAAGRLTDILTEALVGRHDHRRQDFRDGILFVPEVLLAANAMKAGMFILKPLLAETGAPAWARW
jgi:methanogenic corrinoid protein MtbC1